MFFFDAEGKVRHSHPLGDEHWQRIISGAIPFEQARLDALDRQRRSEQLDRVVMRRWMET